MSTAKPHRRLTLTRPTGVRNPEILEPQGEGPEERDRLAALEARCARLEALLEHLIGPEATAPFRVSDAAGRPLLEVDGGDAGAWLRLFDASGTPVAELSAGTAGGGLTLLNGAGAIIGSLVPQENGGSLAIYDRDGNRAAVLEAGESGGRLEISTPSGEEGALLSADPEGGRLEMKSLEVSRGDQVDVVDTGGGLDAGALTPEGSGAGNGHPESAPMALHLRDETGLRLYSRTGRKTVGLYAEGIRGKVHVYDESGACVYIHE